MNRLLITGRRIAATICALALMLGAAACGKDTKPAGGKTTTAADKTGSAVTTDADSLTTLEGETNMTTGAASGDVSGEETQQTPGGSTGRPGASRPGSTSGNKPGTTSTRSTGTASTTIDYGDVKPGNYNPSVSSNMKGTLTVNKNNVINRNIIGGGVNFNFSDYVYYDFTRGDGFNYFLPYYYDIKEMEDQLWDEYFKLIDFSGMQYVRLQVSYTQWEPINDNGDPNTTDFDKGFVFSPNFKKRPDAAGVPENTYKYMEKMYRLLDYFEKKGLFVVLGNWGGSQTANGFCPDNKNWLAADDAPNDRKGLYVKSEDEFAESMAAMMYHLIVEKKYTCVKGFSIFNEPEHFDNYVESLSRVYNKCGRQLTRLGIRDKVSIQAVDGAMMWTNEGGEGTAAMQGLLNSCGSNMDILSLHHYVSTIEAGPASSRTQGTINNRLIKDFLKPAVELAGNRPVVVGELGTFAYANETGQVEHSAKTHKLPIFNAEAATAVLNNGAKGYGLWVYNTINHPYFTMLDYDPDERQRFVPDSTNYYPTALMLKYLPAGTNIVQNAMAGCTLNGVQRVFATVGVKNAQTSILLVNDSDEPVKVKISGVDTSKRYNYHFVSGNKTDRIYPGGSLDLSKTSEVALRPQSITVLTTYTYGTQTVR